MNYKKKLKTRLYIGIVYIVLGIAMITGAFLSKTNNDFISSFGFVLTIMGIARVKKYFIITKDEETIKKQQTAETDERNLSILNKARSTSFSAYVLISGIGIIILSVFNMHKEATLIAYSVCLLVALYWIFYWIYQKKS